MRVILTTLAVLCVLGWFAVLGLSLLDSRRLGGDALNGVQERGRYWVADHGQRKEVTAEEFRRNQRLGIAFIATLPLFFAGLGYLLFTQVFRRGIYLRDEDRVADGAERVRRTGPPLAEAKTGGRLGKVKFGGPFIRVAVHPGGLLVKPLWLPAFGIRREDLRAVRRTAATLGEVIEVDHASPDVGSPLRLFGRPGEAFLAALEGLAARTR